MTRYPPASFRALTLFDDGVVIPKCASQKSTQSHHRNVTSNSGIITVAGEISHTSPASAMPMTRNAVRAIVVCNGTIRLHSHRPPAMTSAMPSASSDVGSSRIPPTTSGTMTAAETSRVLSTLELLNLLARPAEAPLPAGIGSNGVIQCMFIKCRPECLGKI